LTESSISPEARAALKGAMQALLGRIPRLTRLRGLTYANGGRVTRVTLHDNAIQGLVRGSLTYTTSLMKARDALVSSCSCPSHLDGPCKHVAALLYAVGAKDGEDTPAPPRQRSALAEAFPMAPLRAVSNRLGLYAGKPVPVPRDPWRFLRDHFDPNGRPSMSLVLDATLLEHEREILADVAALRAFVPPPHGAPESPIGALYTKLARAYFQLAERATLLETLPGPLDARHPGFSFEYLGAIRAVTVRERSAPALVPPRSLEVRLSVVGDEPVVGTRSSFHATTDLWELFALRALLLAIQSGEVPALVALGEELAVPTWERLLTLVTTGAEPDEPRTIHFALYPVGPTLVAVKPFTYGANKRGKYTYKRIAISELAADGRGDDTARRLARLLSGLIGRDAYHAVVDTLTPTGHEVLRALADYPRLHSGEPHPSEPPSPVRVVATDLALSLDPDAGGTLHPTFRAGDTALTREDFERADGAKSGFVSRLSEGVIVSCAVSPKLMPWVTTFVSVGESLSFPPEAIDKVTRRLAPLVEQGAAILPRTALGAELTSAQAAALRVEWRPDGAAVVELMVSVHPSAPLIAPAQGPTLFTFHHEEQRVFVERDFDAEIRMLEAARDMFPPEVEWDPVRGSVGSTMDLEGSLGLSRWLAESGVIARVESKMGRRPSAVPLAATERSLNVSREGAWLAVRGDVRLGDKRLTLGEILEAARLSHRFVPLGDGAFLEIPPELQEKLRTLATATDLARPAADGAPMVHEAFTQTLADLEGTFDRSTGLDVQAFARDLMAARKRKRRARPKVEMGELRPYQAEGAAWMAELAEWAPGCVLSDDMGLGKTVQTAALLHARRKLGPQLVVAPASVTSNWVAELARFVPSLKVTFFNAERERALSSLGAGEVLVVSYGLLARVEEKLAACEFATCVLDEAQFLKNALARRSSAARGVKRRFTVALTGTPVENHLGDLHALVDQVFPGLLGPEPTFRERFRKPIETSGDDERLAILSRLLAPFLLRRTRKSVLEELPARDETTRLVELSDGEAKRYAALRRACELQMARRQKGETAAQTKIALLAALTRLRQLACDVSLVDDTWTEPSTKLSELVDIVLQIRESGHRVLVFSQFKQLLDRAVARLERVGLRVGILSGETPTLKRAELVASFQAGEKDVFCISLMAGGTGLNLTAASYVVHLDPWWNPAAEEQATSRAHRMGQRSPVTVIRLVSKGTIEEAILDLHERKRDLASAVLEGKATATTLTPDDLLRLLRFGA